MCYFAAIDIGSNAVRLAIAKRSAHDLRITYRSREPVRLGSSVFTMGKIDDLAQADLEQALFRFKNQLENHNVEKLRAVATSAMRESHNGLQVVQSIFEKTGIEIEIISGDEEAKLVTDAIQQKLDLSEGRSLLIDIGGGSVELIALDQGSVLRKKSYPIGMVRMLKLHEEHKESLEKWLPDYVKNQVSSFFDGLAPLQKAVGTGGNMDRFIKIKSHITSREGIDLSYKEMEKVFKELNDVSYEKRIVKFGLKPDRADVILPAALVTQTLMKMGGCEKILIPQVGLQDGLLIHLSSSFKE